MEALEASVADQAIVAHWPCSIVAGFAEIETDGAAGGGGGGTATFFGQRAFAMAVASFAIRIPSSVRHAR
ncbi:hypothetical protein K0B90_08245 [bacterium]|nr:hypothetical protein [bacterium]